MIKKYWHFIFPVLIGIMMVFIFCMSAQPANDSTITSSHVCRFAAKFLIADFRSFDASVQNKIVDGMTFVVRKAAHFTEYSLLGFLGYIWLHRIRHGALTSFLAVALYAITDETHQLFVPGRSASVRDVLIDSTGALSGIIAAFIMLSVIYCLLHKDVVEHGVWKDE